MSVLMACGMGILITVLSLMFLPIYSLMALSTIKSFIRFPIHHFIHYFIHAHIHRSIISFINPPTFHPSSTGQSIIYPHNNLFTTYPPTHLSIYHPSVTNPSVTHPPTHLSIYHPSVTNPPTHPSSGLLAGVEGGKVRVGGGVWQGCV